MLVRMTSPAYAKGCPALRMERNVLLGGGVLDAEEEEEEYLGCTLRLSMLLASVDCTHMSWAAFQSLATTDEPCMASVCAEVSALGSGSVDDSVPLGRKEVLPSSGLDIMGVSTTQSLLMRCTLSFQSGAL
jgi:hypothetical protein